MLRKTLKYDLKAVYKIWLILTLTVLAISVLGGLCIRDLVMIPDEMHSGNFTFFSIIGVVLTVFALSAYVLIIQILVLYRYYQNFFTDEGYLTFTLPVKRSTLFNSKLINSFIWTVANMTVLIICLVIILAIAPTEQDGSGCALVSLFSAISKALAEVFELFDGWAYVYAALGVITLLLYAAFSTLLTYACVTLGCTMVKKYKLLMAILTYYIVNMLMSTVSYIGSFALTLSTLAGITVVDGFSEAKITVLVLFLLIGAAAFMATVCALAYKFSLYRIEKNLNLA